MAERGLRGGTEVLRVGEKLPEKMRAMGHGAGPGGQFGRTGGGEDCKERGEEQERGGGGGGRGRSGRGRHDPDGLSEETRRQGRNPCEEGGGSEMARSRGTRGATGTGGGQGNRGPGGGDRKKMKSETY